ncbi:MAG: response regulator [Verrucomicrobiota bacterium]
MDIPPTTPHFVSRRLVAERSGGLPQEEQLVLVLDDDLAILRGLERLLTAHGYRVRLHSEAEDFFRAGLPTVSACLILDNQLGNGTTGIEVHAELQRRAWDIPTVFVTAHWNVQSVVDAMRAGADGFLTKPYEPQELVDAVAQALQRASSKRQDEVLITQVRTKAASLTTREREIVQLVIAGLLNKEIADRLNLAVVTVKIHRGRAMRKLGAGNPAELARLAVLAGFIPSP